MRDFQAPKMPSNWNQNEKTFYIGLMHVLEEIYAYKIGEKNVDKKLLKKISTGTGLDYRNTEQKTNVHWLNGEDIYRVTQEIELTSGVSAKSLQINGLALVVNVEGFLLETNGSVTPLNFYSGQISFRVRKNKSEKVLDVYAEGISGKAYLTVYYTKGAIVDDTEQEYIYDYYDNGFVNGIEWEANPFPRPNYTIRGESTLYQDYMLLYIASTATTYNYNTHVATKTKVTIPKNATKLCVNAYRNSNGYTTDMRIGFLPEDAPNVYDLSKGGALSETFNVNTATPYTYEFTFPEEYQGKSDYKLVITIKKNSDTTYMRYCYITKVWFE